MIDMDMGTGAEDLTFREHDAGTVNPTGRLMGTTTTGFTQISPTGTDGAYTFAANTTYTGSLKITRVSATEMQIDGALGATTHSVTDTAFDSDDIGMLAFWANSNVFGSSATAGQPNNGIDFSNVTIEFTPAPVPEPGAAAVMALGLAGLALRRGRRA